MTAFGKYSVVERIGEGGFGQVYLGRDPQLKRDVAIKTISLAAPQARERFLREAEIAASLRHPSIVTIYDFGEQDGVPYLVQEYLPGEDMSRRIQRGDAGDLAGRVGWLLEVAEGLSFAHGRGVVHRDVKPSNVRIVEDGSVRIVDFGIAKVLDSEQQLTGTNMSVGTSGYLAPEQLEGRAIDHRADMFSFGVMAYELLTFQRPFVAPTIQATLYKILTEDPAPIPSLAPDCPARLVACVDRCLRKQRDERFADFGEVIGELRAVLVELATGAAAGAGGRPAPESPDPEPGSGRTGSPGAATGAFAAAPYGGATGGGSAAAAPTAAGGAGAGPANLRVRKYAIFATVAAGLGLAGWAVAAIAGGQRGGGEPDRAIPIALDSVPPDSMRLADPDPLRGEAGSTAGRPADRPASPRAAEASRSATGSAADPGGSAPTGRTAAGAGATREGASQVVGAAAGREAVVDAARVLVLIRGDRAEAVATAQSVVLAELLARGRPFVDPDAVDALRANAAALRALAAGGAPAAGIGREYGAGTVVVGELATAAGEGVAGFVSGTAVLTARYYDTASGRLLLSEKYQIGAGGTPARAGANETDAITQAAEAVARQMSRAILQKTGGG